MGKEKGREEEIGTEETLFYSLSLERRRRRRGIFLFLFFLLWSSFPFQPPCAVALFESQDRIKKKAFSSHLEMSKESGGSKKRKESRKGKALSFLEERRRK